MDEPADSLPQQQDDVRPQCARCSAELVAGRGTPSTGVLGVLLAVAGVCLSGFLLLDGSTEWLPAGVAAFIFGVEMSGDRLWWECPECGRRYGRALPAQPDTGETDGDTRQNSNPEA